MHIELTVQDLEDLDAAIQALDFSYGTTPRQRALRKRIREALEIALDKEAVAAIAEKDTP